MNEFEHNPVIQTLIKSWKNRKLEEVELAAVKNTVILPEKGAKLGISESFKSI